MVEGRDGGGKRGINRKTCVSKSKLSFGILTQQSLEVRRLREGGIKIQS